VVSLIVTYSDNEAHSPEDAVAKTLELTRDDGSSKTHWYVFDRQTQTLHLIQQGPIESLAKSFAM